MNFRNELRLSSGRLDRASSYPQDCNVLVRRIGSALRLPCGGGQSARTFPTRGTLGPPGRVPPHYVEAS